jgi:DNA-binding HxlR family transcriptional regulator
MAKPRSSRAAGLQYRDAIELLGHKWRTTILYSLTSGSLRASELQRAIRKVSPKMLTQTLRGMERDGLIHRHIHNFFPPHVEYELTQMGESVIPLLHHLCHWAKTNAMNRDAARRRFDESLKNSNGLRKNPKFRIALFRNGGPNEVQRRVAKDQTPGEYHAQSGSVLSVNRFREDR